MSSSYSKRQPWSLKNANGVFMFFAFVVVVVVVVCLLLC